MIDGKSKICSKNLSFLHSKEKLSPYNPKSHNVLNKSLIASKVKPLIQPSFPESYTISTTPFTKHGKNLSSYKDTRPMSNQWTNAYKSYMSNSKKFEVSPLKTKAVERQRNKSLDFEKSKIIELVSFADGERYRYVQCK